MNQSNHSFINPLTI